MINKITLKDDLRFNELGILVNNNFCNLFSLESLINSPIDDIYGYYVNNYLVGFIHVSKLYETLDIVNIVVDEQYRRQGIATQLINYVCKSYDDINNVMLEVNEHNVKAINLYLKNGFYEINRRLRYYGQDTAVIMKRDV